MDPIAGEGQIKRVEDYQAEEVPRLGIVLLSVAMLISTSFQTIQLVLERNGLNAIKTNQEPAILQVQQVRMQFISIAKQTLQLAQQGNRGAATIVEQLAKRGVKFDLPPASPPPPAGPNR